jgi:hypothetical protein
MEAVMESKFWDELAVEDAQAGSFAQEHFGGADLGHKARNRCLLRIAELICRHPGGTLPTKLANPADYDAMDRLMNRPETTHASVLASHLERTRAKLASRTTATLVLHDTTVLDYSGLKSAGLGPVGNGGGRGYLCHNSLAVDPARREVLGLAQQILHRRVKVKRGEGVKAKRQRRSRESRLWSDAVETLGPLAPRARCTDVADRGADVYEFLATEQRLGRAALVRACYNRVIVTTTAAGEVKTKLFDHLRGLPAHVISSPSPFFHPLFSMIRESGAPGVQRFSERQQSACAEQVNPLSGVSRRRTCNSATPKPSKVVRTLTR